MIKTGRFLIAFCWAHVRRDFLDLCKSRNYLEDWCMKWVENIRELYHLNKQRLEFEAETDEFIQKDSDLRISIDKVAFDLEEELSNPELHPACRKVLESLKSHWSGLTLFVDYPWIPMDNNRGERTIRTAVVGRKNYYGSGSEQSAELTSILFSLLQTIILWGLNVKKWLRWYLEACAKDKGKPPNEVSAFLPWNLSKEKIIELGGDPSKVPKPAPEIPLEDIKCHIDTAVEISQSKRSNTSVLLSKTIRKKTVEPYLLPYVKNLDGEKQMTV